MKKFFFILLFSSLLFSLYARESGFPKKLSKNAKISILSVDYNDISHSLFSKSCLRVYDKDNQFDKLIDFAYFEDFNDKFFGLKFFIKNKQAEIKVADFFNYFLEQNEQKNVSLTESLLDLSNEEIDYIYQFLKTIHEALPIYLYDFDIITNNSETHISQILHDCYRMVGKNSNTEPYSFLDITKHNLNYKKINDSYVLLSERESLTFNEQDFSRLFSSERFTFIVVLIIVSVIFFITTCYQVLVYFFENFFISSVYKSIQIFDFMILFAAGLSGLIIIFQDFFSNQAMLRNNFQFLFLFPVHIIAAFSVFKTSFSRKIQIIYWSSCAGFSVLYILILSILEREFPVVTGLLALPILLRNIYFDFLAIDIKKHWFKKTSVKN